MFHFEIPTITRGSAMPHEDMILDIQGMSGVGVKVFRDTMRDARLELVEALVGTAPNTPQKLKKTVKSLTDAGKTVLIIRDGLGINIYSGPIGEVLKDMILKHDGPDALGDHPYTQAE